MTLWLLDTNIASLAIRGDDAVLQRLVALAPHQVKVSAITQAELWYGVAKRGHPHGLALRVREFLLRVQALAWAPQTAATYADLRAQCEAQGTSLAPLDMLIAAHAKALAQAGAPAVLVTCDKAFARVPGLVVQDWSAP